MDVPLAERGTAALPVKVGLQKNLSPCTALCLPETLIKIF